MRFSLAAAMTLPLLALAACAHNPPPRPSPDVAPRDATLTSGTVRAAEPELFLPWDQEVTHPTPFEPVAVPPLDQWAFRYPDAAMELGQWALGNPETARALARWQGRHPEQMEALVDWSLSHPYEPLGAFLMDRAGWTELLAIAGGSDELHGFMAWIRRAPTAATELTDHTDGLAFADDHAVALSRMSRVEALLRGNLSGKMGSPALTPPPAPPSRKNDDNLGGAGGRSPTGPVD